METPFKRRRRKETGNNFVRSCKYMIEKTTGGKKIDTEQHI